MRGEPNLTAEMFHRWIKNEHTCEVSALGFKQVNYMKGVYFDGHEREDVVTYRDFC